MEIVEQYGNVRSVSDVPITEKPENVATLDIRKKRSILDMIHGLLSCAPFMRKLNHGHVVIAITKKWWNL
jgi:hypothetical protein